MYLHVHSAEPNSALNLFVAADSIKSRWEAPDNTIQQYVTCSVALRIALIIKAEHRLNN